MSNRRLFLSAIVCIVILAFSFGVYLGLMQQPKKSWLAVNDFVVYKQDFAWAEGSVDQSAVRYMFWNITDINGDIADVQLLSHGVQISNSRLTVTETEIYLKVNVNTRQVVESQSQSNEMPVGSEFPFWIPKSVKAGDPIQTSYGGSTISPSQTLQIMGQSRDCWLVAYTFNSGNNMNRYYDAATGICLLIQSHIYSNGVSVAVNETAVETNIKSV